MSVLQKKIDLQSTKEPAKDTPLFPEGAEKAFMPIAQAIAEKMAELTDTEFDVKDVELLSTTYESSAEAFLAAGLYCASLSENDTPVLVTAFDSGLPALITNKALKSSKLPSSEYKVSRLDMTLFKPIFERTAEKFQSLLDTAEAKLFTSCEGKSLEDVSFTKKSARLMRGLTRLKIKLHCPELIAELETPSKAPKKAAPKANKAKAKAKPKADEKDSSQAALEAGQYAVEMILPEELALKIVSHSPLLMETDEGEGTVSHDDPWSLHMQEKLKEAPANIRIVVESFRMSVADCTRLSIGQVIPLPGVSLQSMGVEVEMENDIPAHSPQLDKPLPKRVEVARATLGIYKTNRAVKLIEDLDPSFVQDMSAQSL